MTTASTTLSLSQLYRRLGVRSRIMPEFRVTPMEPVVVVADMSRSYAPEAVEGRHLWAQTIINPGVFHAVIPNSVGFEFSSRAPGGVVIESLEILITPGAAASGNCYFKIVDDHWAGDPPAWPWADLFGDDIGGEPVRSNAQWSMDMDTPLGADGYGLGGYHWIQPTDRTYIGPGRFLRGMATVQPNGTAFGATISTVVREVPEMLGAP